MTAPISKRIERLQKRFMGDGSEDCEVTITFKSGNIVKIPYYPDFTGYFDDEGKRHKSEIEQAGWRGEIEAISCDNWKFSGVVELAAGLWGARYVC